jgi:alanine racemase
VVEGRQLTFSFLSFVLAAYRGKSAYDILWRMIETGQTNWVEVDLSAIRQNVRRVKDITGRAIMAVVKANAYGHGLSEASRAAVEAGATWLGVARVDEALFLHRCGIPAKLIVLGYTPPERAAEAAAAEVRLAVYDHDVAQAYAAQAQACGRELVVHAKFDTGMGRLGADPEDGVEFVRLLMRLPGLSVEGAFTHMAEADDPARPTTLQQLDCFDALLEALQAAGLRPGIIHAANSAAALYFPRARYDLVRPGIAIYGLHPSADAPLPDGFRPALSWKTRLASVKMFPPEHGIGYNYRYYTSRDERIGVCAAGYADGFRRRAGNFALTGGRRVPVVGGICMDQCMLQLDEVPAAQIGDEVVLLGRQGSAEISAEELGREWGTFNYEVVCGLMARLPRIYKE